MKIFATGTKGWVGSVVVNELIANGRQVRSSDLQQLPAVLRRAF